MQRKTTLSLFLVLAGLITEIQGQELKLDFTKMWKDDVSRVNRLLENGTIIQKQRVICSFPKDLLSNTS